MTLQLTPSSNLTTGCESVVIGLDELGETELSGDEDLLSTWELHLGSSEGLSGALDVFGGGSDGHENLTDVYSCRFTETFTEGTSHTLLESIGTRHESILLILTTCHGWTLILMWKFSLPTLTCMYLLQAILAASRASEVICSFS